MDVVQDCIPTTSKKKLEKSDSPVESSHVKHDSKKLEKKSDCEDPKPRIVLTFRSEKPGAKSSSMKIVSTEEKHEEISPRRSNRTRAAKWESDDDNEVLASRDKSHKPLSENEEVSDSSQTTPKRSSRRRSKEFDNIVANAIARKEKSYEPPPAPTRLSRRIKPTAKVLANEELRIGLESQNNVRLGIQPEKSPEGGVRTRRSARSSRQNVQDVTEKKEEVKDSKDEPVDVDGDNQNQVMKLKHLCELGLKAISPEEMDEDSKADARETDETEAIIDDQQTEEDEEIDDDSEVISKLLEAADDESTSDEEYACSTRRSRRSNKTFCPYNALEDSSSPVPGENNQSAPIRRSSRKRKHLGSYEYLGDYSPTYRGKSVESQSEKRMRDEQSEEEQELVSDAAGGEEGSQAACPADEARVIATCYCEEPSNVYPAPTDLIEPVFCQAIESIDGLRVGCSHSALRDAPLLRAGPRAPYFAACALHRAQLQRHMCCCACAVFCSQGTFYQCLKGHLFHLECGLPYNDAKLQPPGCPHCGVHSHRCPDRWQQWQPVSRDVCKVQVQMKCSNKRIFLPEQREQCTPAYLGFSTLKESQLDQEPVIPEDLLPSPPIDLKRLCQKTAGGEDLEVSIDTLCDAILARESVDQLISKIVSCANINSQLPQVGGGTCAHAAAKSGNLAALYLLQYAGADLDAADAVARTPLMIVVLELLDKTDTKSPKKIKIIDKENAEEIEVDKSKEESEGEDKSDAVEECEMQSASDEDLMKIIRYLVAAGCDVNLPGPDGMTALHMAAQHGGEAACAAILSAAGAEVDPRDQGGWTPLVWAAENCHAPVVRVLLEAGADATAPDCDGNAAVHWCALAGCGAALRLLLDAAPRAALAPNAHTDTPLHVAARQGHYACVVILLARGARTDIENSAGELPVEVCSGKCQSAISLNMQLSIAANSATTRQRLLSSDISNGKETYPIPCINEVDDAPLPDDFAYVTSHVTPRHVTVDCTTESLQGCSCKDGSCESGACACCVLGVRRWLARGHLQRGFPYHDPPMLFECNQTCGCNAKKCSNSVVSRLLRTGSVWVRAAVWRVGGAGAAGGVGEAGGRGWGLVATRRVAAGAPVAAYVGELLTLPDADARARDNYMFALDVKPDLLEQCVDKVQLCVDAAQYGGAARFINHSCRPNLAPVRVFTHSRDLRLPTVALFAMRDISPGTELTFDYGDKFWSVKSKFMKCECGEPDCRYPTKTTDEVEA